MPINSRNKGASFERQTARWFNEMLEETFCKRTGFHQAQKGSRAPDVDTNGVFWVECKTGSAEYMKDAIRTGMYQILDGCPDASYGVLVAKVDRRPFEVIMWRDDAGVLFDECASRGVSPDVPCEPVFLGRVAISGIYVGSCDTFTPDAYKIKHEDFFRLVNQWWKAGKQ